MESELNLSERVYLHFQTVIGTPAEVDIRRQIMDIEEIIYNASSSTVKLPFRKRPTFFRLVTGSQREGFRFDESDVDFLYWWSDHKVICHPRQENLYDKETLIMMEYCDDSPGSVLLKVKKWSDWSVVRASYVRLEKETFMSSSKYKESTKNLVQENSQLHGPCASGQLSNGVSYDNAHSFKCDFIPEVASSWITRCLTKGWPDFSVMQYARKIGCHFVPIGRRNSPNQDYEWRISFSLIELRCVHSMNHVQFTCFGIFKRFLSKVIKPLLNDKKLLRSYFLKTVMFFMIQDKEKSFWSPENLIHCFWNCFKRLIFYVYKGNLPNFFIQENNMFQDKIVGSSRESLLEKLYLLYNLGYEKYFVLEVLKNPLYNLRKLSLDFTLFNEINHKVGIFLEFAKLPYLEIYMLTIKRLIKKETLSLVGMIAVRQQLCSLFTHLAFLILEFGNTSDVCKSGYMLRVAGKHGFLSNNLFYGMYLYRMSRYKKALSFARKIKKDLEQLHVLYIPYFNTYGKGKTWTTMLREAVVVDIGLSSAVSYLNEFAVEQYVTNFNNQCFHIPPYVLTLFLIILCNIRLGDMRDRDITLCELKDLLNNDKGRFVPINLRNISWHILGIAQQLSGYYLEAFESYRTSLDHPDINKIFRAKIIRMRTVISEKLNETASIGLKRPRLTLRKDRK